MNYRKVAKATLAVTALITLILGSFIPNLKFDYDFESFFPIDDPDLEFYNEFREEFFFDNEFVLIGIENDEGIFQEDFLQQIESLTNELSRIKNINDVQSPTSLKQFITSPAGVMAVPYLHPDQPEKYDADSARIYNSKHLVSNFFAEDSKSLSLLLQADTQLTKEKSDKLVLAIDSVLSGYAFSDVHLAGRIHGQKYYVDKMQSELALFITLGVIMLVIFLFIAFRTFWGIWVPLLVVAITLIWLPGIMVLTGKTMDIMNVMLPTIIFVVGVSDVVHILTRYLAELRKGKEKSEAVKTSFKQVGLATFLTSVTTAAGFLTLLTANVRPIRDFGIYTAIGVFIAFLLAFSFLPSVLILNKKPFSKAFLKNDFWYGYMHRLFYFSIRNRKAVLVVSIVLTAVSAGLITRIETNNYIMQDLTENDPHRKDFDFFEEHYAGVRPFEMAVTLKDSSKNVFDYEVVKELDKAEKYLKEKFGIGMVFSPLTFIKAANQAVSGGNPEYYNIPEDSAKHKKVTRMLDRVSRREEFGRFVNENRNFARISAKVEDHGGRTMLRLTDEMYDELPSVIDTEVIGLRMTGMGLLLDKNNKALAENMIYGLLIAFGVVGLIMGILYKSPRIVIASLIPNMLPLIFVAGIMGASGINLNISTAIIFTIAFGIAVDDTIHYMSKLKIELMNGKSFLYALKAASITTGKAITVTGIILVSGFVTLLFSTFGSSYYVGLLVSITLFLAVIIDLVLLPVLLILLAGNKK